MEVSYDPLLAARRPPRPLHNRSRLDRGPEMDRLILPGPGSYNIASSLVKRDGCAFMRKQLVEGEATKGREDTPGPTYTGGSLVKKSYNITGTLDKGVRFPTRVKKEVTPGPTDYDDVLGRSRVCNVANSSFRPLVKDTWTKSPRGVAPSASGAKVMKGAKRKGKRTLGGKHDPEVKCSFGAPFSRVLADTPGPGSYSPQLLQKPNTALPFTSGGRTRHKSFEEMSPCAYNPEYFSVFNRSPRAIMYLTS